MKSIRSILAFAFAMVMSLVCVSAQRLPVVSEDNLRNYALGQGARGYRWVESPSMAPIPGSPLYAVVEGDGAEDVLAKLLAKEIAYTIQNPMDRIKSYVRVYDVNGMLLFSGEAEYGLEDVSGKGGGPSYSIWMHVIPMGENVASANILVFDEKGRTQDSIPLRVEDGRLLFPPYFAGAPNGILVVRTQDGNVLTYRLSDPRPTSPGFTFDSGSTYQISGHHVYLQNRDETIYVDFVEVHYLPTVYLEFRKEQQIVVDVQGLLNKNGATFVERPSGLYYETADGQGGYMALNTDNATTVRLPGDGKYRFRFVWVDFGKPNNIYFPTPDDGNGKGTISNTQ